KCAARSAASEVPSASSRPEATSATRTFQETAVPPRSCALTSEQRVDERGHAGDLADEHEDADEQQDDDEGNQPEPLLLPEEREELAYRARTAGRISQHLHGVLVILVWTIIMLK